MFKYYHILCGSIFGGQVNITAFYISGLAATIDGTNISLTIPYGTSRSNLSPLISVSSGAVVSPASGVARNFTEPVTYTVTAPDETTKEYTVTITNALSSSNNITSFTIDGSVSNEASGTNITILMPGGTDVTALTPTIVVSSDATVSPASGEVVNFTSPVTYTVTAQNGDTKEYTVTVNVEVIVYAIGDIGPAGGIVFHIAPDGRYTEMVASPQWSAISWYTSNTNCANYSIENNGTVYDDWDLPSSTEIPSIYTNLYLAGRIPNVPSNGVMWGQEYNSSSGWAFWVWQTSNPYPLPKDRGPGRAHYSTRCVRRFY